MDIGNRIKQRRLEIGITPEKLAEEIGKSRATVYRYENGDIENMPTTVLEPLAEVLHTTPAYLMGWDDGSANIDKLEDNHTFLRDDEEEILIKYNSLNDIGKFEAKKRIDELGMISLYNNAGDYSRQESVITLKAARKKPNATAEDLEEDFKKLDD